MPRQYKKPPLVEASCAFHFKSSQPWDWTIPGRLFERIHDEFSNRLQLDPSESVRSSIEEEYVEDQLSVQFLNRDETASVQVSPNRLAVRQLRPYPMWETFKSMILRQLQIYWKVAEPEALSHISLRYLNRVEVIADGVDTEDYFRIFPRVPETIPQTLSSFIFRYDIPYQEPASTLRLVFGTIPARRRNRFVGILDLEMFGSIGTLPAEDVVSEWVEAAHQRIETVFDASFTERTHKEVFEEVLVCQ